MALTAGLVGNKTAQNGSHVTKTEQRHQCNVFGLRTQSRGFPQKYEKETVMACYVYKLLLYII